MEVTQGVGSMDEAEVKEMFESRKVGILCLEDGDKPYGVPLEHYFDGKNLYFATSLKHGYRKMDCIRNNGNACYIICDSRRDNPDLASKGIRCRSVIAEGRVTAAAVRELQDKSIGTVQLQILKLEIDRIGNWKCPRKACLGHAPWFERYPELIKCI